MTNKQKDIKLAKEVNWLYHRLNKKEFHILMKWVSANCDVAREDAKQNILKELDKQGVVFDKKLGICFDEKLAIKYMRWLDEYIYNAKYDGEKKAKQKILEIIDKMAKKTKAVETDIGEYDKFISVWELKKKVEKC